MAVIAMLFSVCVAALPEHGRDIALSRSHNNWRFRHCTIFTLSRGGRAFFAGNDDCTNRDSCYWVDSGGDARGYGAIYFGQPDNVQQGVNEEGLAYDANGLPPAPVKARPERKPVQGGYTSYPIQILRACATVAEVIAWAQTHQWHTSMHDQLHFADATGDAVVISAGPRGELAFTRKPAGDGFLVSTNFNRANPNNGSHPCWRYTRAERMLEQVQSEDDLTLERMASILEAVHLETPNNWTLYSVVADFSQRLVYVYFWFQYDAPAVLHLDKEIARGPTSPEALSGLFPPDVRRQADRAYQRITGYSVYCTTVAIAWLAIVGGCFAALILLSRAGRPVRGSWIPVVALLGPAGLCVWVFTTHRYRKGTDERDIAPVSRGEPRAWLRALVEATGDVTPYVPGTVAVMLVLAVMPGLTRSGALLALVMYGLPWAGALLFFQGPLLAYATRIRYFTTVFRRLPSVVISTSLALTGIVPVTVPLVIWGAQYCPARYVIVLAWAIAAQGALVSGLLLYAYHCWAARRGFTAWSALLLRAGEGGDGTAAVSYPPWRRLWLWILLSAAMLLLAVALTESLLRLVGG